MAIGYNAQNMYAQTGQIALGANATTYGENSIAIGRDAKTEDNNSGQLALGYNAAVKYGGGIALGSNAVANRTKDVADAYSPYRVNDSGVAATKATTSALSIGGGTLADGTKVLRQITNVAAGGADTDAVNVAQLKAVAADISASSSQNFTVGADSSHSTNGVNVTKDNNRFDITSKDEDYLTTGVSSDKKGIEIGLTDAAKQAIDQVAGNTSAIAENRDNITANTSSISALSDTVKAGWEADVNGTKVKDVTPESRKLNFKNGQNISITGSGDDITVATADELTAAKVTTGNTVMNTDGVQVGDSVSLTSSGLDNGGNQITGVKSGIEGARDAEGNTATVATAAGDTLTHAANIGDVQSAMADVSWTAEQNGVSAGTIKNGGAVNFANGAATTASVTSDANGTKVVYDLNAEARKSLTKADSALQSFQTSANGTAAQTIDAANNKANFTQGDNIVLTPSSEGIQIATAKNVNFNSVGAGTVTVGTGDLGTALTTVSSRKADGSEGKALSVAGSKITNLEAGTEATDAVNVSQLNAARTHFYSVGSTTASDGNYNNDGATGIDALAVGVGASASGTSASAVGNKASASGLNTSAFGANAKANGDHSAAIGDGAIANGENAIAIGNGARTAEEGVTNGIAIGQGARAEASSSVALGSGAVAHEAVGTSSYEIGGSERTFAGANPSGTVSIGTENDQRTITNVAAGRISATSTDAVNGSQLYQTVSAVNENHEAITTLQNGWTLAASAKTGTTGTASGSSHAIKAGDTATLEAGNNVALTQNGSKLTIAASMTPSFTSVTVPNGSSAAGTSDIVINGSGISAGGKTITGVAAGVNDTDAVNKGQLISTIAERIPQFGDGKNTTLGMTKTEDGIEHRRVDLNDHITLGSTDTETNKAKAVDIDGTAGQIAAGDKVVIDGTTGNIKAGTVTVNGSGTVNDLSNRTWDINNPTVVSGQAATEDQLKTVSDAAKTNTDVLSKGLSFKGDDSTVINKKLGETMDIRGGASSDLTDGNIGVVSDNGALHVKLSKDIRLGDTGSVTTGGTTVNNGGITVRGSAADGTKNVTLGKSGLDNGGNTITNVAPGTLSDTSTDAVNGSQLYEVKTQSDANAGDISTLKGGWYINSGEDGGTAEGSAKTAVKAGDTVKVNAGKNLSLKQANAAGETDLTLSLADRVTLGNGADSITIDGTQGTISMKDAADATSLTLDGKTGNAYLGGEPANANIKLYGASGNATFGNVAVSNDNGTSEIKGLSNRTIGGEGFATAGRAATEEQLQLAMQNMSGTIETSATRMANGTNTTVSGQGTTADPFKVSVNSDLVNMDSATFRTNGDSRVLTDGTGIYVTDKNNIDENTHSVINASGDQVVSLTATGINAGSEKVTHVASDIDDETGTNFAAKLSNAVANNPGSAVNVRDLGSAVESVKTSGLDFVGNDGGSVHRDLGATLSVRGGLSDVSAGVSDRNLGVKKNDAGDGLTVVMSENPEFTSVTAGNTAMTSSGITISGEGNPVSLTTSGLNNGGNKITGVAKGEADTDAVNVKQLKDRIAESAYNWNVSDGVVSKDVPDNTTVTVKGSANGKSATDAGIITHLNEGNVLDVDLSEKTKSDINKGVAASSDIAEKGLTFKAKDDSTTNIEKLGSTVTVTGDSNIRTTAAGDTLTVGLSKDITGISSVSNGGTMVTLSTDVDGKHTVDMGGAQLSNVKSGLNGKNLAEVTSDDAEYTNGANIADVQKALSSAGGAIALTGMNYQGNDGSSVHRSLGDTLSIKGGLTDVSERVSGENLGVKKNASGDGLDIVMTKTPSFDTVTAGTEEKTKVVIGDNAVTVGGKTYITNEGLNANGQKVTGVAPGDITRPDSTDAVNGSQLYATNQNVSQNTSAIENQGSRITQLEDGFYVTADGDTAKRSNIKAGDTVNFAAKDGNTTVTTTKDSKTITIGMSKTPTLDGVTVTNTSSAAGAGDVIINGDGINAGNKPVTNVADGKVAAGSKDAVNGGQLYELHTKADTNADNISANAGDISQLKKTWNLDIASAGGSVNDGHAKTNVASDATVTLKAGKNIALTQDGTAITVATSMTPAFDRVVVGNDTDTTTKMVLSNTGLKVGDTTYISKDGLNAGNQKITNVANGKIEKDSKDAVNGGQLWNAIDGISESASGGFGFTDDGETKVQQDLGKQIRLTGKDGITVTGDADGKVMTFGLSDKVSVGASGENGKDGSLTVSGKDGSSVTVNGKDGSIGLKGADGADGTPGSTISVKGQKGDAGVNGTDGVSRLVVDGRQIATLDDGVKYSGDSGSAAIRLNKTAAIIGGADTAKLSENNIGVVAAQDGDNAKLTVKLAKDLEKLSSVETVMTDDAGMVTDTAKTTGKGTTVTDKDGDKTELTADGVTINRKDNLKDDGTASDPAKTISLTSSGLSNGGNKITNVADGENDTDAVNMSQLNKLAATVNGGLSFAGDAKAADAPANAFNRKMGGTANIVGGIKDPAKLSDNNIGVISNGTDTLTVKLAKDISGVSSISMDSTGKDYSNVTGVPSVPARVTLSGQGLRIVPKSVLNEDGTEKTDAASKRKIVTINVDGNNSINAGELYITNVKSAVLNQAEGTTFKEKLDKAAGNESLKNNAVNISDLQALASSVVTAEGRGAYGLKDERGDEYKANLGETIQIVGDGSLITGLEDVKDENGNAVQDANGKNKKKLQIRLSDTLNVGKAGQDGKEGTDGSIGVNGKNGQAGITLSAVGGKNGENGSDGRIGLTGRDGLNVDGNGNPKQQAYETISIRTERGQNGENGIGRPGVNGKDFSRIVYNDGSVDHTVATLDDGMKYGGDAESAGNNKKVISKKLNQQVNVIGGISDETKLTGTDNLGVVSDGENNLKVRLAKDLKGLSSVATQDGVGHTTIMSGSGVTITPAGGEAGKTVSLTQDGLNNGGNRITGVAAGTKESDAVNKAQLDNAVATASGTVIGKGLMFGADSGTAVTNKLGSRVDIKGAGTKSDDQYSGSNLKTSILQDGSGNTTINVLMDKNASFTSVTAKDTDGNVTATNGSGVTINSKDNLNGDGTVKDASKTVSLTKDGLNNGGRQITNTASGINGKTYDKAGYNNGATIGDVHAIAGDVAKVVADSVKVTVKDDGKGSVKVTESADKKTYTVGLSDTVTIGSTDGKKVTVDGTKGTIGGLTNKTWNPDDITSGQAATEDQLKAVSEEVSKAAKPVSVTGGNNIRVEKSSNADGTAEYKVSTAEDLSARSVTIGSGSHTTKIQTVSGTAPDGSSVSALDVGGSQITGVADGKVEKGSKDAVNGGQLAMRDAAIINNANAINAVAGQVGELHRDISETGAMSAALAGLKPLQYDPLEPTQIMAGFGHYRDENAVALGVAHYTNESTMFHIGASVGRGEHMYNAGVTWKVGSRSAEKAVPDKYRAGPISSVYVLQDEVRALQEENKALRDHAEKVEKDNREMKEKIDLLMKAVGLSQ